MSNTFNDNNKRWFYKPGELHAHDTAHCLNGTWIGDYGDETQAQIEALGMKMLTWEEFSKAADEAHEKLITDPVETTKENFHDMLACLPPHRYTSGGDVTFFCMSEFYSGDITSFFGHYKGKYFSFRDRATTKKETIITKIIQAYDKTTIHERSTGAEGASA